MTSLLVELRLPRHVTFFTETSHWITTDTHIACLYPLKKHCNNSGRWPPCYLFRGLIVWGEHAVFEDSWCKTMSKQGFRICQQLLGQTPNDGQRSRLYSPCWGYSDNKWLIITACASSHLAWQFQWLCFCVFFTKGVSRSIIIIICSR